MPFIGDLIGVAASSYILAEAHRLGVGRALLARMAFNVAVEGVIGIVPFLGDVFDAGWKANQQERAAAQRLGRAAAPGTARQPPYSSSLLVLGAARVPWRLLRAGYAGSS